MRDRQSCLPPSSIPIVLKEEHHVQSEAQSAHATEQDQDAARADVLFSAVMQAHFTHGQDIGSLEVLADIAASIDFNAAKVRKYMNGSAGEADVVAQEIQAQLDGIRSMPTYRVGNHRVTGGQPPEHFASVLRAAVSEVENI